MAFKLFIDGEMVKLKSGLIDLYVQQIEINKIS